MPLSQDTSHTRLDAAGVASGFRRMAPLCLFVVVFGMAFGVAAPGAGLSQLQTLAMSALVFAGSAQFAALDLWGPEIPLIALIATTLAINARHLLMGAALYPWLKGLPTAPRYASMLLVSDSNWAMAIGDFQRGERNVGVLVGGGIALWLAWMLGTLIGVTFGAGVSSPQRFGLDVIMGCFLLAVLLGGKTDRRILACWMAAGLAAVAALKWLPDNTHVIVGAIAGGVAGLLIPPKASAAQDDAP